MKQQTNKLRGTASQQTCVRGWVGGIRLQQVNKHLEQLRGRQDLHCMLQALCHRAVQSRAFLGSRVGIKALIKQLPGALVGRLCAVILITVVMCTGNLQQIGRSWSTMKQVHEG